MSRTDVHRPPAVQQADPHNRHLFYRFAAWHDRMELTPWRNLFCGCRLCSGHYWRRAERRRERYEGRRECRVFLG